MFATLSNYGLLKISGNDRQRLLQGQLTCNVDIIHPQQCQLAAHCNPQGRIISLSHLFQYQDSYYMLMQRNMVPIAQEALKKYALFYKVSISDASNEWICIGSNDKSSSAATIAYHQARFINLLSRDTSLKTGTLNWQALNIKDGLPTIYPQTSAKFLPHELNLHRLGAISFEKGCYTGQEIIARMHYRGQLKKQMYKASITTKTKPMPGDEIYAVVQSTMKACGMIVDICADANANDRFHALIMIEINNAFDNHLFLQTSSETARPRLPQDQAYFELEKNE